MNGLSIDFKSELSKFTFSEWHNSDIYNKYNGIEDYPLTVIQAKVGSGKRKCLLTYFQKKGIERVSWYLIDNKTNLHSFWIDFINAIKVDNNFIKRKKKLLAELSKNNLDIKVFIQKLSNAFVDCLADDIFIVFDYLDLLNNKVIIESLNLFVEWIPDNIHLVFITRKVINWPKVSIGIIKDKVQVIDEENFALDQKQLDKLLIREYNLSLSPSNLKEFYLKTEGWLLAVDLLAKNLQTKKNLDLIIEGRDVFKVIFDYFEEELSGDFAADNPLLVEFLIKTSILDELDLKICNLMLGISNSQELLERLNSECSFVKEISEGRYKYNNILRSFLKSMAKDLYDYEALEKEARNAYAEFDDIQGMFYHTSNFNKQEVFDLIVDNSDYLIEKESDLLRNLFKNKVSKDTLLKNPYLFLVKGCLNFNNLNIKKAMCNYQYGLDIFREGQDIEGIIKALQKMIKLLIFTNSNKSIDYMKDLDKYKTFFSQADRQQYKKFNILIKVITSDLIEVEEEALDIDVESNVLQEIKAHISFIRGDLHKIELYLDQDNRRKIIDYHFYNTIVFSALINILKGNMYKLQNYILNGFIKANIFVDKFGDFYLIQSFLLAPFIKIDLKKMYMELLKENNENLFVGNSFHRFHSLMYLIVWDLFNGDIKLAISYSKEGLEHARKRNDLFFISIFKYYTAISYYFNGNIDKAERLLIDIRDEFSELNNNLFLCRPLAWLSLINYKKGNNDLFKDTARELFKICRRKKFDFLFLQKNFTLTADPNLFLPILLKAKAAGIEVEYIDKLFSKMNIGEIDHAPGYVIKIEALGGFKVYRGNEEIKEQEWKRKKAKELLKIFLLNYGKLLSRELICTELWPDKGEDKVKLNFSVTLSSLNKVLEPNRKRGELPFFIRKDGNLYGISNTFSTLYDVSFFEELIDKAKESKAEVIRINYYKQAINLYQDDFLNEDQDNFKIIKERKRLKRLYLEICHQVMEYEYKRENYGISITIANKILAVNSLYESAYLYKMKSYKQLGLISLAIEVYEECKDNLLNCLSIKPNSEIEEYYKLIK
ncbi:BTAD domain-containing putative transcriptional regulator [Orenia marismortui]|uniref:BTAD domain-containing putative transcriptional regulator n=1 Tax=Orenia marismortui TaxID=46469 RepID=UPI000379C82E|nr:BTAD domain-containing putative transcriptional regulator [Orenia marismortui]